MTLTCFFFDSNRKKWQVDLQGASPNQKYGLAKVLHLYFVKCIYYILFIQCYIFYFFKPYHVNMFYCYYTCVPGINKGINFLCICLQLLLWSRFVSFNCCNNWFVFNNLVQFFLNGDKLLLLFTDALFQFLRSISKWMSCECSHVKNVSRCLNKDQWQKWT